MTPRLAVAAGVPLALLVALAGCTSSREPQSPPAPRDPGVPAGQFKLVAFDSCANGLELMKKAAKEYVGPYGFGGDAVPSPRGHGRPRVPRRTPPPDRPRGSRRPATRAPTPTRPASTSPTWSRPTAGGS
ncbi:hypothetical protein [Phytohabitans suffuscus]|uniref:hypothetical protein n=1 Tax=Phytohabitans suffuscus TaxID=624315 RepID=UPI001E5199EF|nr:hypothetical protein [Phytohabitans suffuscus]